MLLTNDVSKIASRRGIAIDGTILGFAVAYCILLVLIHCFGIYRIASASDPKRETQLRDSKLTGIGEMILFVGLLMVLVGFLIIGPGIATWTILLALVLVVIGGLFVAVGINETALKAALVAIIVRRRNSQPSEKAQRRATETSRP